MHSFKTTQDWACSGLWGSCGVSFSVFFGALKPTQETNFTNLVEDLLQPGLDNTVSPSHFEQCIAVLHQSSRFVDFLRSWSSSSRRSSRSCVK